MIPKVYAGARRHKVALQRKSETADGGGGSATSWQTFAEPRARIRSVSVRERLQASQLQSTITHRALIPFVRDPVNPQMPYVKAKDRFVQKGVPYDIRAVVDLEERQRWLELDLESGVAS